MMAIGEEQLCAMVAQSDLFDGSWYLEQYPDVMESCIDPVFHYVRYGEKEGRRPSAKIWGPIWQKESTGNCLCDYIMLQRSGLFSDNVIPVVFACNENYAPYLSVALASLIHNASPQYNYALYIFYYEMSVDTLASLCSQATGNVRILPLCVASYVSEITANAYVSGHVSVETYFRILIPRLLSPYAKCVYLDCDLIVNSDIAELYNQDIGSSYVAGAEELWGNFANRDRAYRHFSKPPDLYVNAGVLLINNTAFTRFNLYDKFMKCVNSGEKYPTWDQDILNIICDGHIARLDGSWNYCCYIFSKGLYKNLKREQFRNFMLNFEEFKILHFAADVKPWFYDDGHFSSWFWKYAIHSPWFASLEMNCPYEITGYALDG